VQFVYCEVVLTKGGKTLTQEYPEKLEEELLELAQGIL